jgi:hypothetical protein
MKVCLICVEIFAWGKYGGFGRATRMIGRELVKRGIEVYAVVPRRKGQRPIDSLDGIKVLGFPPLMPWKAKPLLKECDADIYHSCEPSLTSYLALKALPYKKHIVTVRDPRDYSDWETEFRLPSLNRLQVFLIFCLKIYMCPAIGQIHEWGIYHRARFDPKGKTDIPIKKDPLFWTPV